MTPARTETLSPPLADTVSNSPDIQVSKRREAFHDLLDGLRRWRLWLMIGWLDIRQKYRRSLIGPLWITLSLGVFVLGLAIVYAGLFGQDMSTYLPFLAVGVIVWTFIAATITEGCTVFIAAEGAIKQVPVPISVHVYRLVWRNVIIFGHNMLIYLALVAIFPVYFGSNILAALPGIAAVALNGIGFALICGVLSTRFRDIPLMISNLVQMLFFTTPIFWRRETLPPDRQWVVDFNPFHYFITIVRDPLLGHLPDATVWLTVGAITVANLVAAALLYVRCRGRIAYWL